jgi:hypothetical protein
MARRKKVRKVVAEFVPTAGDHAMLDELNYVLCRWLYEHRDVYIEGVDWLPLLAHLKRAMARMRMSGSELRDLYHQQAHGAKFVLDPLLARLSSQIIADPQLKDQIMPAEVMALEIKGIGTTRKPGSHRGPY